MPAEFVTVRIPAALRDLVDAVRPSTTSREAFVRETLEAALAPVVSSVPVRAKPAGGPARVAPEPAVDYRAAALERQRHLNRAKS